MAPSHLTLCDLERSNLVVAVVKVVMVVVVVFVIGHEMKHVYCQSFNDISVR